jgi:hypothetical protein
MTTTVLLPHTPEERVFACANRLAIWFTGATNSNDSILPLLEEGVQKRLQDCLRNNRAVLKKQDFEEIEKDFSLNLPLTKAFFEVTLDSFELLTLTFEGQKPLLLLNDEGIANILSLKKRKQKEAA